MNDEAPNTDPAPALATPPEASSSLDPASVPVPDSVPVECPNCGQTPLMPVEAGARCLRCGLLHHLQDLIGERFAYLKATYASRK